jgi:hypothetical protein
MENNMLAGQKYKASQKLKWQPLIISLSIGLVIAIGIGWLYGVISSINPIIYLNILLLFGAVFLLVLVSFGISASSKSRNNTVNLFAIGLICISAWLSHWAYVLSNQSIENRYSNKEAKGFWHYLSSPLETISSIGDYASHKNMAISSLRTAGSGGLELSPDILVILYFVEFLIFMLPAYYASRQKSYYCEGCNTPFLERQGYLVEKNVFSDKQTLMKKGNFSFVENLTVYQQLDTIPLDPKLKPEIVHLSMHSCSSCNNAIVNAKLTKLKYNDDNKRETSFMDNYIIEDTYITKQSQELLHLKLW